MAKLVSHPALNRKSAGSIPAASAYGACGLTVKTPVCGTGNEGSTPSLCPWDFVNMITGDAYHVEDWRRPGPTFSRSPPVP